MAFDHDMTDDIPTVSTVLGNYNVLRQGKIRIIHKIIKNDWFGDIEYIFIIIYSVERVFKIKLIISIIFYVIYWAVRFELTHFLEI